MRLWSIHPKYLDPQGLVALWREALLAKAVMRGETKGYRHHPQLQRFQQHPNPLLAINAYLAGVHAEATARGYNFDRSKIGPVKTIEAIEVTDGQVDCEWQHLMRKLDLRNPELGLRWRGMSEIDLHPCFVQIQGPVADWERAEPKADVASKKAKPRRS